MKYPPLFKFIKQALSVTIKIIFGKKTRLSYSKLYSRVVRLQYLHISDFVIRDYFKPPADRVCPVYINNK